MSTTVTEEKAALRRWAKDLPKPDWSALTARFLSLPQVEQADGLFLFYGVGKEPDTLPVITELLRRGKRVALPRCLPGGEMEARFIGSTEDLTGESYGIPEPGIHCPLAKKESLSVALIPHLCCDRAGYRLGHGGGYYDRWLRDYSGFTVALCPVDRLVDRVPREEYDLPVDLVLT